MAQDGRPQPGEKAENMSKFVQTVRFLVGLALVAGGVVLAGPFVSALVVAHSQTSVPLCAFGGAPEGAAVADGPMQPAMHVAVVGGVPQGFHDPHRDGGVGYDDGGSAAGGPYPPGTSQMMYAGQPAGPSEPPRPGYVPPQPPAPLPAFEGYAAASAPGTEAAGLDTTYRSTLDIPPPPLLDAHSPPPLAVAWSAHDADGSASPGGSAAAMPPATVPGVYSVRDGDDLTGIATRMYGHPGAAAAIWAANRDRLENPEMLPIGFQLRMPPSWTVPALQSSHGRRGPPAIEPGPAIMSAGAGRTSPSPALTPAVNGGSPSGWLQATGQAAPPVGPAPSQVAATPFHPGGGMHQVAATLPGPPAAASGRPGTVRVGAGDTLASLAQRFYGDPAMAGRIWEANRDRIRSPGLVVPGMELRLP